MDGVQGLGSQLANELSGLVTRWMDDKWVD